MTLQNKAIAVDFQPGGILQNRHHGVRTHAGADHHIKIPGDIPDTGAKVKGHFILHAIFAGVAPGGLQGALVDVGCNDSLGDSVCQKVDT